MMELILARHWSSCSCVSAVTMRWRGSSVVLSPTALYLPARWSSSGRDAIDVRMSKGWEEKGRKMEEGVEGGGRSKD